MDEVNGELVTMQLVKEDGDEVVGAIVVDDEVEASIVEECDGRDIGTVWDELRQILEWSLRQLVLWKYLEHKSHLEGFDLVLKVE